MNDNDLKDVTLADLARVFVKPLADLLLPEMKKLIIESIGRPVVAPPMVTPLISVSEARKRLPCGCRMEHLYEALKCGALRGRQQQHGRRTWLVDVDDLQRWDAAGRPLTHLAVVPRRAARLTA